jgi:hypothetical protein
MPSLRSKLALARPRRGKYPDRRHKDLIVFHAYDAETGRPSMQLSTIDWTGGWPHASRQQ